MGQSRIFTISNFSLAPLESQCTDALFDIYLIDRQNNATEALTSVLPAYTNLTYAQLVAGMDITIPDTKPYINEAKIQMQGNPFVYKRFSIGPCAEDSDCFTFKFIIVEENQHVAFFTYPGASYSCRMYWGDYDENGVENYTDINAHNPIGYGHAYTNNDVGSIVTARICGAVCDRFTFEEDSQRLGGFKHILFPYDPILSLRLPIKLIEISSWGTGMFLTYNQLCKDMPFLRTLPNGSIPYVVGSHDDPSTWLESTFENCIGLEVLTNVNGMFSNFTTATAFKGTFAGCKNLEELNWDIFAGCQSAYLFNSTFENCYKLKVSKNTGRYYYEDRIYHNGDTGYPSPGGILDIMDFTDTYQKCSGDGGFPVPYWQVYTGIITSFYGCYAGVTFLGYTANNEHTILELDTLLRAWRHDPITHPWFSYSPIIP
jgi:hypothetical protein